MKRIKSINDRLNSSNNKPIIMSGPCSAETEEQLIKTAIQLKETNTIDVLRAGIWKPRTKPGKFISYVEEQRISRVDIRALQNTDTGPMSVSLPAHWFLADGHGF